MPLDVSTRSTTYHRDPPPARSWVPRTPWSWSRPSQTTSARTILVAEDDNNSRRALQHYLSRFGYHVIEAGNVAPRSSPPSPTRPI